MAGHGLDSIYQESQTAPYLVAYWDYYSDTQGQHSLEVTLADGSLFKPVEVYICNHPWPYWGNICGDGFASPLDSLGAYFSLKITGYDDEGGLTGSKEDTLAQGTGTGVNQSINWHPVNISSFISYTKKLVFTMESTDADPVYGPNTAVYFCMDKLKVVKQQGSSKAPSAKVTKAGKQAIEVTDHIALTSHKGGVVTVYDNKNKEVLRVTVKAGKDRIDLSKLPAGEYRVRHGHKSIPIKKVNKV
jgi:hypothetical protein